MIIFYPQIKYLLLNKIFNHYAISVPEVNIGLPEITVVLFAPWHVVCIISML